MTNADVIRHMTDKQLDEFLAQFEIGDIDYAVGDMVKELAKDTGGDLINRQAAIDAINQICPIDTEYDCTLLDRVDVRRVLTDLPSAQPERTCVNCGRTANNTDDDYPERRTDDRSENNDSISRKAAIGDKGRLRISGKKVIDVCCGGKHFWFDKENPDVEFCDKRYEEDILLCNGQHIHVTPDVICDFKNLPFDDESFYLAVFDPPHLINKSEKAWMVKKYGTLPKDWKTELKCGFDECMRVLKPYGTLVFKWNEAVVPTKEIIECFGKQPLFGHKSGKRMGTQWLVFIKSENSGEA